jgi:hypothetical protein
MLLWWRTDIWGRCTKYVESKGYWVEKWASSTECCTFFLYHTPDVLVPGLFTYKPQKICLIFLPMAREPPVGQGVLLVEVPRSHSDALHSVGLLWTRDQSDAETSNWRHTTLTTETSMPPPRDSNPRPQQAKRLIRVMESGGFCEVRPKARSLICIKGIASLIFLICKVFPSN